MGHDAVMVKIADDIYLSGKADWVTKEFKDDLRKQVELLRHNLIGMKAENLVMDSYKGIFVSLMILKRSSLYSISGNPTVDIARKQHQSLKLTMKKQKMTVLRYLPSVQQRINQPGQNILRKMD